MRAFLVLAALRRGGRSGAPLAGDVPLTLASGAPECQQPRRRRLGDGTYIVPTWRSCGCYEGGWGTYGGSWDEATPVPRTWRVEHLEIKEP